MDKPRVSIELHFAFLINKARLKLVKNLANAKPNPEAEPLLFESYSRSSSALASKNGTKLYKSGLSKFCGTQTLKSA